MSEQKNLGEKISICQILEVHFIFVNDNACSKVS